VDVGSGAGAAFAALTRSHCDGTHLASARGRPGFLSCCEASFPAAAGGLVAALLELALLVLCCSLLGRPPRLGNPASRYVPEPGTPPGLVPAPRRNRTMGGDGSKRGVSGRETGVFGPSTWPCRAARFLPGAKRSIPSRASCFPRSSNYFPRSSNYFPRPVTILPEVRKLLPEVRKQLPVQMPGKSPAYWYASSSGSHECSNQTRASIEETA
jgi:hypothetical protein